MSVFEGIDFSVRVLDAIQRSAAHVVLCFYASKRLAAVSSMTTTSAFIESHWWAQRTIVIGMLPPDLEHNVPVYMDQHWANGLAQYVHSQQDSSLLAIHKTDDNDALHATFPSMNPCTLCDVISAISEQYMASLTMRRTNPSQTTAMIIANKKKEKKHSSNKKKSSSDDKKKDKYDRKKDRKRSRDVALTEENLMMLHKVKDEEHHKERRSMSRERPKDSVPALVVDLKQE